MIIEGVGGVARALVFKWQQGLWALRAPCATAVARRAFLSRIASVEHWYSFQQRVSAAGSERTAPNLSQIVRVCLLTPISEGRFRTRLSPPSPAPACSKSPLTPAALDLDDASVSSTLSIIGSGAVAKSASVRAPWAKLHGRIAVICLQASTVSLRTAQSAPHCKDRANHNGQAAGLHTCQEQLAAVFHQTKCRGTPTKPAARPARNREQ